MFIIKKKDKYAKFNLLFENNKFILLSSNIIYVEFNIEKK